MNRRDSHHSLHRAPVTAAAAWAGWQLWRGYRRGAVVSLALLPVEAVYWLGFALPIPWLLGAARVALVAAAWKRLWVNDR